MATADHRENVLLLTNAMFQPQSPVTINLILLMHNMNVVKEMMKINSKWAVVALTTLLLVSVAGNLFLFKAAKSFYTRIHTIRLDPLGGSARNFTGSDEAGTNRCMLILGDSRAADWHIPDNFYEYTIVNGGIGSQTTAQILGRVHVDLSLAKPTHVLLQAGVNDLKTLPLFPHRKEEIIANCKTNLESIISKCVEAGSTVIISTIFPVGESSLARRPVWSQDVSNGVSEVNAFLRSLSTDKVVVFDAYSILLGDDGLIKSDYKRDTLHLNDAGYKILNQELRKHIEAENNQATRGW